MSYEPTQWKAGDTVTSAKLNKIEQGIANFNILIAHLELIDNPEEVNSDSEDTTTQYYRLDKTLGELLDADFIICFTEIPYGGKIFGWFSDIGYENDDQSTCIMTINIFGRRLIGTASEMTEYPIIRVPAPTSVTPIINPTT